MARERRVSCQAHLVYGSGGRLDHTATRSPKDCRTEDEAAVRERDDDVLHVGWDPSFS